MSRKDESRKGRIKKRIAMFGGTAALYAALMSVAWIVGTRQAEQKTEDMLDYAVADMRLTLNGVIDTMLEHLASVSVRHFKNPAEHPMEKKALIMRQQTFFKFPSDEERNAFLSWAISAGKLKNQAQFDGAYEASSQLVDAFEAKLKTGAPLGAQDILDCYKAFSKTAMEWMFEDAKAQGALDYGPDDRQSFFGRIASVALSRLAVRLGNEALGKIAAAFNTPDGRWLYHAFLAAQDADTGNHEEAIVSGTIETASAFLVTLLRRIPEKHGFPINVGDRGVSFPYAAVPPFARAFIAQISQAAATQLAERESPTTTPPRTARASSWAALRPPTPRPCRRPTQSARSSSSACSRSTTTTRRTRRTTGARTTTAAPTPRAPSSSPSRWATSSRRRASPSISTPSHSARRATTPGAGRRGATRKHPKSARRTT
jgi:hypothetical protein